MLEIMRAFVVNQPQPLMSTWGISLIGQECNRALDFKARLDKRDDYQ